MELRDVRFRYVPDRPLIEDFRLTVQPGQRVAIVGPTGCGKTTLINLLMRFYDVDGGSISVSGTDVQNITRTSLRRSYGMVLQDTWLKGAPSGEEHRLWPSLRHPGGDHLRRQGRPRPRLYLPAAPGLRHGDRGGRRLP